MPRENKPLEAPTDPSVKETRNLLNAQPKVTISLHQNREPDALLPDKTVQINGYTYQIQRGKRVPVPQSVYEVLVQAGEVPPISDEDEVYVPTVSVRPLTAADISRI